MESPHALRENVAAYLFIAPSVLIIAVFGVFPVFFTVYVSLFKWRLVRGPFIGLANYSGLLGGDLLNLLALLASIAGIALASRLLSARRSRPGPPRLAAGIALVAASIAGLIVSLPFLAFGGDKEAFDSLRITIWYAVGTVPVQLGAGVVLAVLLNRRMRGRQAFRVVSLLPYIAPTVASAAVFELLLSLRPDSFANQILLLFRRGPLQWLQEPSGIVPLLFGTSPHADQAAGAVASYWMEWGRGPSLALVSIIFYSWWVFIGYYALIYLNGLSAIPRQLYEAAEVDGASRLRSFFSITLPLLSPSTYFLSLLGVIGTFKAFTHIFVLRHASAGGTVDSISVSIFFTGFRKGNLGYASAMSILLFAIVLGLTILHQRTLEKGVSYGE